jgi:hypothetical protein
MERLGNNVSTVIKLWKHINIRTPEKGDSALSETSASNNATRYNAPEDIFNWYRRESIPED